MARRRPFFLALSPLVVLALLAPAVSAPVPAPADVEEAARSDVRTFVKAAPETIEDLKAIERRVQAVATKVAPSTVGVRVGRAQGSGVIVTKDGYVLTAAHVAGSPGRAVTFILNDGREVRGVSLGLNRDLDSGLMKITDKGEWPAVEMGDMSDVHEGDWCIATGHPGGFREGRTPVLRLGRVILARKSVIQTDCTLVGGDSGGPLFDLEGRVIGINSRIGQSTAWNFHVPISVYKDEWDQYVESEEVGTPEESTAILGVSGDDHREGCRVTGVGEGMPADQAGIRVGDIITRFDGRRVRGFESLAQRVRGKDPGDEVVVELLRDGVIVEKSVVLAKRPE